MPAAAGTAYLTFVKIYLLLETISYCFYSETCFDEGQGNPGHGQGAS